MAILTAFLYSYRRGQSQRGASISWGTNNTSGVKSATLEIEKYTGPNSSGVTVLWKKAAQYRIDLQSLGLVGMAATKLTAAYDVSYTGTSPDINWTLKTDTAEIQSKTTTAASGSQKRENVEFTGLTASNSYTLEVLPAASTSTDTHDTITNAAVTIEVPDLSVSASPATVAAGDNVTLTFGERFAETLTVTLKGSNGATLKTATPSKDAAKVKTAESWFSTAGETGTQMTVTVDVADTVGRTATTSFILTRPTKPTLTPRAPKSQSFDGGDEITFSWDYTGEKAQASAEVQYSTDNVNWILAGAVSGDATTFQKKASFFGSGTKYWRMQAADTAGQTSDWSSSNTFSVHYSDPTVTLTAPTSGSKSGAADIEFGWSITKGSGTVTGTEMQYSTDDGLTWMSLLQKDSEVTRYTAKAGTLPAGKITWHVRAKDSISDWSEWKQASFTVTYGGATTSIIAPSSGQQDGAAEIEFAWEITPGGGDVTGTQLQFSTDGGLHWASILDEEEAVTSYTAKAGELQAGTLKWQVRARDSYAGWGDWDDASFTVTYGGAAVTLTTPTSGSKDRGEKISFLWEITPGGGDVTGTQMEYTTDDGATWNSLVNADNSVSSYEAAAGFFPAGAVKWRVRVKDQYAGWSTWRQASFSVTERKPTVTLSTPTSGEWEGGNKINFVWVITPGSGTITGTQLAYSTDDGATWQSLLNESKEVTSYSAAIAKFPAGRIKWHVRAKDQYAGWSDWKEASFTVSYSAVSQVVPVNSPTSGNIAASTGKTYSVKLEASGPVYTPFTITDAAFFWRAGTSGEFTEIAMTASGSSASVTVRGGTFPSGIIQWYAEATDNTGRTTQTGVYTLQALNAAVEAFPVAPNNVIKSSTSEILFEWAYVSLDGSPQRQALLEYSRDGATWEQITISPGSATAYPVGAGFFPYGGTIFWRVTATSTTGAVSPASAPVSFTLFGAPYVEGVTGDDRPFCTITWQTAGQVSYQIEAGGTVYGPYFGPNVRSFRLPEPLPDGSHTVKVRAQNRYGVWSPWESSNVSIVNVPGPAVTLTCAPEQIGNVKLFIDATRPEVITRQPQDLQTTDPERAKITVGREIWVEDAGIYFNNFGWKLQRRLPGSATWTNEGWGWYDSVGIPVTVFEIPITTNLQESNGAFFRVLLNIGNPFESVSPFEPTVSREFKFIFAEPFTASEPIVGFFPPEAGDFLIYRDGKRVGRTWGESFTDKTSLGEHTYFAIQTLPGGYYSTSNTVTGTANVRHPMIAPLEGGDFIPLRLSASADRAQRFTLSHQVSHTHYSGAKFPAAEVGEHETLSASFDVAYRQTDRAAADAFEALVGQAVILKTPGGKTIVGVLEGFELDDPRFYKSYRCTLQQMDWMDFTYETGGV